MLPLPPNVFTILLLLRGEALHGYGIMKQVNEGLGRRAILGPGTLYRTLKEMRDGGLIDHAPPPRGEPEHDERRSYYRLTPFGHEVVLAEAGRLNGLMRRARIGKRLKKAASR